MDAVATQLALEERVEQVLAELRPMIAMHQGDVQLVDITPEGVAMIEFAGSCTSCAIADTTLNVGLKESIMLQIPEITDVIATNMPSQDRDDLTLPTSGSSPIEELDLDQLFG